MTRNNAFKKTNVDLLFQLNKSQVNIFKAEQSREGLALVDVSNFSRQEKNKNSSEKKMKCLLMIKTIKKI